MYLAKTEIVFYFVVYVCFLLYGIYHICMLSDVIYRKSSYNGFTNGWSLLNRKKDNLDFEWDTWKYFVWDNRYWFVLHLISSEIIRWKNLKLTPYVHVIVTSLFIVFHYNLNVLSIILLKIFSFVVLMHFNRKTLIWINGIIWMGIIIGLKFLDQHYYFATTFSLNEIQCYELIIFMSWNILKTISFSIDYITKRDEQITDTFDLINILGYVLYFPNLLLGPFIVFERYCSMKHADVDWNLKDAVRRHIQLGLDLSRSAFWFLFAEFALHFIYLGNLQNDNIEIVSSLNPWTLYTFGYLMGQFFHIKYVVFYGLAIAMAKYENIKAPGLPKCIGRIHLYSNMWKYFDQGLYEFLLTYIYTSLCQKTSSALRKLFASFITFAFIYLWHGIYKCILIWSILNFLCLQMEHIGRYLGRINEHNLNKYISQRNQHRLIALLATQVFIPAVIANFYFFADVDVGNIFIDKTYVTGNFVIYLSLTFSCYCVYHVSEVVRLVEIEKNKIKQKKTD